LLGSFSHRQNDLVFNALNSNLSTGETLRSQTPTTLVSLLSRRSFNITATTEASIKVSVPALGESITDGAIATILKQKGEQVKEDEVLVQIETDKVTIDVRAPTSGTVEAILVGFMIFNVFNTSHRSVSDSNQINFL
jgi:biotin carboxyl carrier protein